LYKSVFVTFSSRKFSIYPSGFISQENLKPFFERCFPLDDLDELHKQPLPNVAAECVFAIPNQFSNPVLSKHPSARFYYHLLPLIEEGTNISKVHTHGSYLFINVNRDWFELLIFTGGKVALHNSFSYLSPQDILYYLLYTIKQLGFEAGSSILICSGQIDKNSNLYRILVKYFESIRFATLKKGFIYSYTFNKFPAHQFANLLNLYSCVS
jgi:hypothetical protein